MATTPTTDNAGHNLIATEPRVIYECGDRKIILFKNKAVKSGLRLDDHEAAIMRYIAENTTIPVPKVYKVEKDDEGSVTSIEMEYMPGRTLDKVWPDMTEAQRLSVMEELRGYILQLRKLKGNDFGTFGHRHAINYNHDLSKNWQFETKHFFNRILPTKFIDDVPKSLGYFAAAMSRQDHEIVFAHGDLTPRNILVDDSGRITAILDWEFAGWYPAHWERIRSLPRCP